MKRLSVNPAWPDLIETRNTNGQVLTEMVQPKWTNQCSQRQRLSRRNNNFTTATATATTFEPTYPVGLLAQLIERYTGIAKVMGSNPLQDHYCSSSVHYCEDRFNIHVLICSSNIWLSYIHITTITTTTTTTNNDNDNNSNNKNYNNEYMCFPNPYFVFSTPSNPLVDEY